MEYNIKAVNRNCTIAPEPLEPFYNVICHSLLWPLFHLQKNTLLRSTSNVRMAWAIEIPKPSHLSFHSPIVVPHTYNTYHGKTVLNDKRHIPYRGLRQTDIPQVGRYTRPQLLQTPQKVASEDPLINTLELSTHVQKRDGVPGVRHRAPSRHTCRLQRQTQRSDAARDQPRCQPRRQIRWIRNLERPQIHK